MKNVLLNKALIQVLPAVILIALLASSCSTEKKTIKQPLKDTGTEHIFSLLKKGELRYKQLSIKFSAQMSVDKKETSIGGQMRIQRDSAIWISFTALGLEAARILITLDSVKFLNRIDNTYLCADYSFINDNLNSGFDFDMLQALLVGNDLAFYENDQFKGRVDGLLYLLTTPNRHKLKKHIRNSSDEKKVLVQDLWISPETGKISQVNMKELGKDNKKLETRYNSFLDLNGQQIPVQLQVDIKAEKNFHIELEYTRVKIDEPLQMPFTIPEKYTGIDQKK